MEQPNAVTILEFDSLLDAIRQRPAMYLGRASITALYYFLSGFETGLQWSGRRQSPEVPPGFAEWVAYRLRFGSSRPPYHEMILKRIRGETAALDRFFELIDDLRSAQNGNDPWL